jgi:hypothetical protein
MQCFGCYREIELGRVMRSRVDAPGHHHSYSSLRLTFPLLCVSKTSDAYAFVPLPADVQDGEAFCCAVKGGGRSGWERRASVG